MKLLLDENLSRNIIPLIENEYPGATQVALIGLERAKDLEVWEYAKKNDFIIVTKDSDYYDLSLLRGAPPYIIWLRNGNCSKRDIAELLIYRKPYIQDLFNQENHFIILR